MARARRKGRPIHGWLSLDKPAGMTSTEAVARVRRLTQAAKVGHGGTLDPLATGVLPIALGEATKTVAYVMDGRKRYRFTAALGRGARPPTTRRRGHRDQRRAARARPRSRQALPAFVGTILQVPPRFAAIKVDGERAYDLARRGEPVELAARTVEIERLALVERPDPDHATLGAGLRPRHLRARAGARSRRAARLPWPCRRAAPPAGRAVPGRERDLARRRSRSWSRTMPCRRRWCRCRRRSGRCRPWR